MKIKYNRLTPLLVCALILGFGPAAGASITDSHLGYILLQVEAKGEAWYLYPKNGQRYFLGRPADAFSIMKKLALGAKHDYIANTTVFPDSLSGLILLDVEQNGEAYYIYPKNKQKYYLGRPADAFRIMSDLGLGISSNDLNTILKADINSTPVISTPGSVGKILQSVPFTSQAPYGNWQDLRQEDGCEEASSLMAVRWALGKGLSKDEALAAIIASSDYTLKKYGEYRDISAADTLNWIIKDYFNYQKAAVLNNVSQADIIAELNKGNVIIAPMNGQALANPYFTPPGPITHMLLIRGYDAARNVFITNDPGTRHGELYEYDADILFKAIRAYPTGNHEPITKIEKNVIVVWK
ncbi:MAG: C39 family peptidase [Patescibacteria group bacterium]